VLLCLVFFGIWEQSISKSVAGARSETEPFFDTFFQKVSTRPYSEMRASAGSTTTTVGPSTTAFKANVQVCARVRPFLVDEKDRGDGVDVKCRSTDGSVTLFACDASGQDDTFYFDHVFNDADTFTEITASQTSTFEGEDGVLMEVAQKRLFDTIGKPLIEQQCRGVNVCVIALGPTGGGKSHTIVGGIDSQQHVVPGLAMRMISQLQQALQQRNDTRFHSVSLQLQVYEMFGERIKDLLADDGTSATAAARGGALSAASPLMRSATMSQNQISSTRRAKSSADLLGGGGSAAEAEFQDMRVRSLTSGVHVEGLRKLTLPCNLSSKQQQQGGIHHGEGSRDPHEVDERSLEDILSDAMHRRSGLNRSRASMALGPRVHLFLDCVAKVTDKVNGVAKTTTMRLVDMCGTEKSNRVRTAGSLSTVHRSLHALRSVVDALVEGVESPKANRKTVLHSPVVPYRDSLFTVLLSEALGGSCRTTAIATVAPGKRHHEESLFALATVQRMKAIVCQVSTREEAVDYAVGALQKELTLLQRMAADGDDCEKGAMQSARQNLALELNAIETEMQSAATNHEALEAQRLEVQEKLTHHDKLLSEMQRVIQQRTSALDQSRTLAEELTSVTEQQATASQQVASEVVLQEKRNAQILVHRQRQASIVRRHESMVTKMESAKQIAEENRRKELASLFRSATMLTKQCNDVRFLRADIDRMLKRESELFTRLRELQAAATAAATLNSEEQLKCDFLTEDLDEVVEEWEATNRSRSDAITEHRVLMRQWEEEKVHLEQCIEADKAADETYREAKHQICFALGIRLAEAEAEVDAAAAKLSETLEAIRELEALTEADVTFLQKALEEESLVPQRERELCKQLERHRDITNTICVVTLECDGFEDEIRNLEEANLPEIEMALEAMRRDLAVAERKKAIVEGSQTALEDFVKHRVFSQETKAACGVGSSPTLSSR
jgi:hypothetical protein